MFNLTKNAVSSIIIDLILPLHYNLTMNNEYTEILNNIESVLTKTLDTSDINLFKTKSFGSIDECININHISPLVSPCKTLVELGGKRWRPLLLVLCAQMTQQSKSVPTNLSTAYNLTPLVEFAHTASLIHDDIEDCADTRRGKPAAHITYGLDVALNAASWLYFEAAVSIQNAGLTQEQQNLFYSQFLQELRRLHLGQAMDILWHRNNEIIPSIDEYTAMVKNKTGTLSRLAVKTGLLAGGATLEEAEKGGIIAEDIGVGFQIIDDVINLTTGNPGKKRGDDIVEGKKSLPVLYYLRDNESKKDELVSLFRQARAEGINSPAVEKAIELISQTNAIEEAKQTGTQLIIDKSHELAQLFGSQTQAGELIIKLFAKMKGGSK